LVFGGQDGVRRPPSSHRACTDDTT
jgi:hypothetical protein